MPCLTCRRILFFFFSSRRRHTRSLCDWSSDVCSSDLHPKLADRRLPVAAGGQHILDPLLGELGELIIVRRNRRATLVLFARAAGAAEIGRASCRERV